MSRLAQPRLAGHHRLLSLLVKTLVLLLAGWVLTSALAEVWMLHPRHWGIGPTPATRGIPYVDVSFKNTAGMTLRGWWMPGRMHETVVMIHGWTSSRRETFDKSGYLLEAGYNVLVFDLRGHGQSDGNYTTMGYLEPDDVRAAIDQAHALDPAAPIALLGYSMGGALAVEEGARNPEVRAVIEDSGFSSLASVFSADFHHLFGIPADPFGLAYVLIAQRDLGMSISAVQPVRDAAGLRKPLLAIVGTADMTVPPIEGYQIYNAAPGPKELLVVPGAGHTAAYYDDPVRYKASILAFLDASLAGAKASTASGP
jgi:pimeloyl-ACP methyl ester carboxylesterase